MKRDGEGEGDILPTAEGAGEDCIELMNVAATDDEGGALLVVFTGTGTFIDIGEGDVVMGNKAVGGGKLSKGT